MVQEWQHVVLCLLGHRNGVLVSGEWSFYTRKLEMFTRQNVNNNQLFFKVVVGRTRSFIN